MMVGLVVMSFSLSGCIPAAFQLMDAGSSILTNRAMRGVEKSAVEVTSSSMKKDKGIEIAGMLKYNPASVGATKFVDLRKKHLAFKLLDDKGDVLRTMVSKIEITSGGTVDSIEAGKEYGFVARDAEVPANQLALIVKHEFVQLYFSPGSDREE